VRFKANFVILNRSCVTDESDEQRNKRTNVIIADATLDYVARKKNCYMHKIKYAASYLQLYMVGNN